MAGFFKNLHKTIQESRQEAWATFRDDICGCGPEWDRVYWHPGYTGPDCIKIVFDDEIISIMNENTEHLWDEFMLFDLIIFIEDMEI